MCSLPKDMDPSTSTLPQTRGYQQEMLEESLTNNIIIAMDTGSGKTHIAILRMKSECEREKKKVSWFLAPTVTLCGQQQSVIKTNLCVSVGLISGALEPDQWKNPRLWRDVLDDHRIIVSTPQPLLDALRHGYVNLGADIGLVVFDEAHHAVDKHPYNAIMQEFYFQIPLVYPPEPQCSRPTILGLTASPIFDGSDVEKAFRMIETNLDCTIRAPRHHRNELASFVHRPIFKHVLYSEADWFNRPFSSNVSALSAVVGSLDIECDPYVQSSRAKLANLSPGPERTRLDQVLSKTIMKRKTYTHTGLKDFLTAAEEICMDVGPWAADWYIGKVIEHATATKSASEPFWTTLSHKEKKYLLSILDKVVVTPVSYNPQDIITGTSDKVRALVECLEDAKLDAETHNQSYSGLVFVTRRDTVLALTEVISNHPRIANLFTIGHLLGSSESRYRRSFLDITRNLLGSSHDQTLTDFKIGDKNLIISTSVAEEGIDIQSCCNVIRWDPPPNMVSWAQSRGRARRERSTFAIMFAAGGWQKDYVKKWEDLEQQMIRMYNNADRKRKEDTIDAVDEDEDDDNLKLSVSSTGAVITLDSAVAHLNHFCAVIPSHSHTAYTPIYDIDPPDFPEQWHSLPSPETLAPYPGPFGSTVTLPRCLDCSLRVFSTERVYRSKASAHRHAAFKAYCALYKAKLLNDHLLPLTLESYVEDDVKELLKNVEKRSGTIGVSSQMDPWARSDNSDVWWPSILSIDGLPHLRLFTRSRPVPLNRSEGPVLHRPNGDLINVEWRSGETPATFDMIEQARIYTREMFWAVYGSRMKWDDLDFGYLFLPVEVPKNKPLWDTRRAWLAEHHIQTERLNTDPFVADAAAFGDRFSFPTDLTLIRPGLSLGTGFRFHRWEFNSISPEQEEEIRRRYSHTPDLEITYPLLVVHPLQITHLLHPISPELVASPPRERVLIPKFSSVSLCSRTDIEYALLLPSILRFLSMAMTVQSLRDTLFSDSSLSTISLDLLVTAITTPLSQERNNYQRLETLGDTVLKFIVCVQLLSEYPHWHEGYLAKGKDHSVSNARLAKDALSKQLYRWIIRDRLLIRKWKPAYFPTVALDPTTSESEDSDCGQGVDSKPTSKTQELSTKTLADVVESLIGAAYLHGGFDMGVECAKLFGLGLHWQDIPQRIETILSRVEGCDVYPPQLAYVEQMIGYEFERKLLLVEALSHSSHDQDMRTVSYERMEFLGDSVLDMVMTDWLYHAPGKKYSPGHIHIRRITVVNTHFLAFMCLRCSLDVKAGMPEQDTRGRYVLGSQTHQIYLWQCLFHTSHLVLDMQRHSFMRYQKVKAEIENALHHGSTFPWAALTSLQAPKFFSDMIESILGAVYLDSQGNFEVVRRVLRTLGILQVLERIVTDEVDVLHPVSRLSMWGAKHDKKIKYVFEKTKGRMVCVILVDDEEEVRVDEEYNGRASQEEVKFAAAERAIHHFKLRDHSSNNPALKQKKRVKKKKPA